MEETYKDLGWFVCLEGSWEKLHIGPDKPDLKIGQKVEVTLTGL